MHFVVVVLTKMKLNNLVFTTSSYLHPCTPGTPPHSAQWLMAPFALPHHKQIICYEPAALTTTHTHHNMADRSTADRLGLF